MRIFDKHLERRLLRLDRFVTYITGGQMTADTLSFARIPLTLVFALAHIFYAPLYPILCWLDAFCDLADGPFSRLIRGTKNGWFWDQAMDKVSNNTRTWIFLGLIPTPALVVDVQIWGYSGFWLLMLLMTNTDVILLTFRVVYLIKPSTKPFLQPGEQASVPWGKIKVWPQQFGIVLFAVAYTHMTDWPTWITVSTSLLGAALLAELIPKDVRFRRLYQAGIFLLFALSFPNPLTNAIPFNTGILLGQIGLAGSVPLGFMSLGGQISRQYAHSWAPRQTREKTPLKAPAEN